eukprot:TRINITY_DN10086_c0_g1_i3.p1 TRINITY_DN10086_c0_g1~~TRINITY_DN10086_c0_g1_i3.p1  ORF type:complete len:520 (+),score=93.31 TRINITY_DN10086_c0_g1_i3:108-1562(+)
MEEALQKTEDEDDNLDFVMVAQQVASNDGELNAQPSRAGYTHTVFEQLDRIKAFWIDVLHEVKQSHSATATTPKPEPKKEDAPKLNTKLLRHNVKRVSAAIKPFSYYYNRFTEVTSWDRPYETSFVLVIYVVCCYYQLLLPAFCAWGLALLTREYLRKQGFIKQASEKKEEDNKSLFERATVVMEVARTVQNHLGTVADWLEKTSNLMTWQDPAKTMRVVQMLTAGLLSSLLIPFWILRVAMKFYIGWKVFVIHPLYRHYPNLKAKHSKSFIRSLPTNAEVSRRQEDADKSDDDSKSITSVGSTNSAKTVTSSPLRQRTASSSSLNRSRTGSSVNVGKGNTPEGNTKSIKPEKVNEQLVQLGVDENDIVIESWICVWLENQAFTSPRKGRLYLTSNYVAFLRSNPEEAGSFAYPRQRLLTVGRGRASFLAKKTSFQLDIKGDNDQDDTIVKLFTGVTNITELIAIFNSAPIGVTERVELPAPPK